MMNLLSRWPIRLSIPVALVVMTLLISFFSWQYHFSSSVMEIEERQLTEMSRILMRRQRILQHFILHQEAEGLQQEISDISIDPSILHIVLADKDLTIVAAGRLEMVRKPLLAAIPLLAQDNRFLGREDVFRLNPQGFAYFTPGKQTIRAICPIFQELPRAGLRPERFGLLLIEYDLSRLKAETRRLEMNVMLVQGSVFLLVIVLVGFFLYFAVTRRVDRLVETTKRAAAGDHETEAGLSGHDELALIGDALDGFIRERNQSEEALRKSEAQLRQAQQLAQLGSWDLDICSNVLQWSDEVFRIYEMDPAGFSATYEGFINAIHPDDREKVNQAYLSSLETKAPYSITHRLLMADGRVKYVHEQCATSFGSDGRPLRSLGTVLDITERVMAEETRKHAEERFQAIVDSLDALVYVADMQTYELLFVNHFGRKLWGDVVGQKCWQALQKDQTGPCAFCTNDRLVSADGAPTGAYVWEFQNTVTNLWFECRDQAIRWPDGRLVRMEIATDITHRKEVETEMKALAGQLRQAQKMEAIGTLAGGIAHDFNNILTPILGYTEMALTSLPPESQEAAELKEVVKAANRAVDLVRQILTFGRQGDQQLKPLKVQLVIKEALKLLRASIPTTIEIKEQIDKECGAVLADPTQIHQVIMNLCTNASHAMREKGGVLRVVIRQVELGPQDIINKIAMQPGLYVLIEVSDTGHGMGKATLERIFDPYFTTKGKGEGTGLGLAVVHGIVKNLAGEITVYSELGRGTTFHVYLPLLKTEMREGTAEGQLPGPLPRGSERVLVVDDEEVVARMTQDMLGSLGYQTTGFTSSEEALAAFRVHPQVFDLLITDMTMPKITGAHLAQEVLAIRPEMPIIICTGFSELLSEEKAKALGIRKFVMKPVLLKEMARAVREVLDTRAH